jgi:hypothetical protein
MQPASQLSPIVRPLLVFMILIITAACSESLDGQQTDKSPLANPPTAVQSPTTSAIPTPVIATDDPNVNGYMDALFTGPLVLEGTCLYLGAGSREGGVTPVFPFGSAVWEDGALIFDGRRIEPGDTLSLGGGQRDYRNATNLSQYPAPECRTGNKLFITGPELVGDFYSPAVR